MRAVRTRILHRLPDRRRHKPICQNCARRARIPSEREAIAAILISSIAMAAAVAIYTGAYLAIAHSVWG